MEKEYTPKEVVEKLGLSGPTVTLYLNKKIIKGHKVSPRKWRIPEQSLLDYLGCMNIKLLGGVNDEK